jgi:hypothetical protein
MGLRLDDTVGGHPTTLGSLVELGEQVLRIAQVTKGRHGYTSIVATEDGDPVHIHKDCHGTCPSDYGTLTAYNTVTETEYTICRCCRAVIATLT